MNERNCPGVDRIKGAPELMIKKCPVCGGEVEIFSNETQAKCPCGEVVSNEINQGAVFTKPITKP